MSNSVGASVSVCQDIKNIECYLLDMDGTIYLSDELIDGAKDFIIELKKQDKKYIFMTNNSSKSKKTYLEKLEKLGIPCTMENIFTSGEATAIHLKNSKDNPNVFLLGTKDLEEEFISSGINLVNGTDEIPDFVVLGFDTTLTYEKIWKACDYIRDGVTYIATHPDLNCPLAGGKMMPDAGAMIKMIEGSTGATPYIIGKPNKAIVDIISENLGISKSKMAMVGDRLYTDIMLGKNSDITSILVLSGETTSTDVSNSEIEPCYIFDSVKDIYENII